MTVGRQAQVVLTALVAGMFFVSIQAEVGETQVVPVIDAAAITNASTIAGTAQTTRAAMYAKQALQYIQEYETAQSEITNLKNIIRQSGRGSSYGNLQSAIAANNANPLYAGTRLAETLVNGGSGVMTSTDLTGLQSEISAAVGALQAHGATLDGLIAVASGQKETTDLQAAIELQKAEDVINAQYEFTQAVDVGSSVPCSGCSGGFSATGIRDYSQPVPGMNPGSVL